MNPKLHELKIRNYKKKLISIYSFLDIENVYYGKEDDDCMLFCKEVVNSSNGILYSFLSDKNELLDDAKIYSKALFDLKESVNKLKRHKFLIFTAVYGSEYFRIKCDTNKFIENMELIDCLDIFPIIFSENKETLISLMRQEYHYELIVYDLGKVLQIG